MINHMIVEMEHNLWITWLMIANNPFQGRTADLHSVAVNVLLRFGIGDKYFNIKKQILLYCRLYFSSKYFNLIYSFLELLNFCGKIWNKNLFGLLNIDLVENLFTSLWVFNF